MELDGVGWSCRGDVGSCVELDGVVQHDVLTQSMWLDLYLHTVTLMPHEVHHRALSATSSCIV